MTTEWPTSMCRTWFPTLSAGIACCAAGSAGIFSCAAGSAGICPTADPQGLRAINAPSASRQRVVPWTFRMASLALFRTHWKFGDCYLAVRQGLHDVRLPWLHDGGSRPRASHLLLRRLLCDSGQCSHINRRNIGTRRIRAIAEHKMDGALVLRQRQLFRLFRSHQQSDYAYVLGLAVRIGIYFRSG